MNSRQGCIAGSVFRLYACGLAMLMWYLGFFEGRSLNSLVAATEEGSMILWAMLICGVIGVLDVFLNDYTAAFRKRPLFESARTYRHFGLSGLAFCHTCFVFIAVLKIGSPPLAIFSFWNAAFIVAFSLIDAQQRSKDAVCRQAFN